MPIHRFAAAALALVFFVSAAAPITLAGSDNDRGSHHSKYRKHRRGHDRRWRDDDRHWRHHRRWRDRDDDDRRGRRHHRRHRDDD
jgi:hypothetical protein